MYYRRLEFCGGTYFFTLVTYQRRALFANAANILCLKEAIQKVKYSHPFSMQAFVLLPDHFHCIWTLPQGDSDFSMRWRLIKSYFSHHCLEKNLLATHARLRKQEKCLWQRRFWEHWIRNETDFIRHMDYIHYNPVKHRYVDSPKDWPHSSFLAYVKKGVYDLHWGSLRKIDFAADVGME